MPSIGFAARGEENVNEERKKSLLEKFLGQSKVISRHTLTKQLIKASLRKSTARKKHFTRTERERERDRADRCEIHKGDRYMQRSVSEITRVQKT